MSSLRRTKHLGFVGLALLFVGACKPTELTHQTPPQSNKQARKPVSNRTIASKSGTSFGGRSSSFIDEAEITDPITFARRVVALSNGKTAPEVEESGTTYDIPEAEDATVQLGELHTQGILEPQQNGLMRALQEARMRDHEDRENAKWAAMNHQRLDLEDEMEDTPQRIQVTRFDRGLGLEIDYLVSVSPIRTTGRIGPLPEDVQPRRQRALMNQVIGDPSPLSPSLGFMCFPVQNREPSPILPPQSEMPGCNDGRDNNANGLVDSDDPVCWNNPQDPGSYSPFLSESEPFNPFGGTTVNASPVDRNTPQSPALPSPSISPSLPVAPSLPATLSLPSVPTPTVPDR